MYAIALLILSHSIYCVSSYRKCTYDVGAGAGELEGCETECVVTDQHYDKHYTHHTRDFGDCGYFYRAQYAKKECEKTVTVLQTTKTFKGTRYICKPVRVSTITPDCRKDEQSFGQIQNMLPKAKNGDTKAQQGLVSLESKFKRCHNNICEPGEVNSKSQDNVCKKNKLWNIEGKEDACYAIDPKNGKKYVKGRIKYCKHHLTFDYKEKALAENQKNTKKVRFAGKPIVSSDAKLSYYNDLNGDARNEEYYGLYLYPNTIAIILVVSAMFICLVYIFCFGVGAFCGWFIGKIVASKNLANNDENVGV